MVDPAGSGAGSERPTIRPLQDVVILPTYDRPELLWLCLEYLSAAAAPPIRLYVDAHHGQASPPYEEIRAVVAKFPRLAITLCLRTPHPYHGNSYNLLMAYKDVYQHLSVAHVFLVEDDVMVQPTFFDWHREQHRHRQWGCSIAGRDPGHGAYSSVGVCFRRERLASILPHCRPEYFQAMRQYCQQHFPPSPFDCEQDGLWARVLKGTPVVWADVPLAQHVGWYGYHRRHVSRPVGPLEARYAHVVEWVDKYGEPPVQLSAKVSLT